MKSSETEPFNPSAWQEQTVALRAGVEKTDQMENSEALFLNSSFSFESAEHAAATFAGDQPGNVYSRFTNPTVQAFERRLAAMESAEACVATASGMAAITALCMGLLKQGDHILASKELFGSVPSLFDKVFSKFGIETSYVEVANLEQWQAGIRPETKMLFLESPSNPLGVLGDIPEISKIAKAANALLVVDNCFCTPILQKPLELGADLVVHSATKYLDGQGRCIGGAVCGSQDLIDEVFNIVRTCGPSMSPFNAWVFLKGLETLPLRMPYICNQALELARWLEQQPQIETVNFPGLESHPHHQLAKKQQKYFGGVVSFEVKGGREAAFRFINNVQLMSLTANLGDVRTTVTHPSTTTHGRLTEEARQQAGIHQGLVRIAVGLEALEDLQADIAKGLSAV
ncbi:O-succinylhomoserine sulfhydrylase [Pelagibaculum spongiae]|uniref:O-succinylhomoserine sulfhydrylase n=1 Tax=Pelagibaculum spongiae TaxID=2080658 RepID=A0A2V1H5I5_9GAMM|nr:O-succinylhomoserine sulfhydrylase [Pelagibaculum spongiae]PVZ71682.1 O-succinylhomoserine sulfhydrylase [Pelagibaculum spongiae]